MQLETRIEGILKLIPPGRMALADELNAKVDRLGSRTAGRKRGLPV